MTPPSSPRTLTLASLAEALRGTRRLAIVCGAGVSYGAAPLAQDIEDGLLAAVIRLAMETDAVDPQIGTDAGIELRQSYLTLELFVSGLCHRVPALRSALNATYQKLFRLAAPNRTHVALAEALHVLQSDGQRRVDVLTSNFDDGLTQGFRRLGAEYRLVTAANVREYLTPVRDARVGFGRDRPQVSVCAYHGTVDEYSTDGTPPTPPTSLAARDLSHPFAPDMSAYVQHVMSDADLVLFIGHRGEDYYDLNIEIRRAVARMAEAIAPHSRFLCIPHLGDLTSVSPFYESVFTSAGLGVIEHCGPEWIADVADLISGSDTRSIDAPRVPVTASDVSNLFLHSVDDVAARSSKTRAAISEQCRALLDDIVVGTLAAWSVSEHYRLESLGYSQTEIAAFAQLPDARTFYGIEISELIKLQSEYQRFRGRVDSLPTGIGPHPVVGEGVSLTLRLEMVAAASGVAIAKTPSSLHAAIAALLAAIAYDYVGLIAMRIARFGVSTSPEDSPLPPAICRLMTQMAKLSPISVLNEPTGSRGHGRQDVRAARLFSLSAALAEFAGEQVVAEAARFRGHSIDCEQYNTSLSQIVGWEDWALAPAENRLRLASIPTKVKLREYRRLIAIRIARIDAERKRSATERSFSAAGNAAQCAQRLAEAARVIANVGPNGPPRPVPSTTDLGDAKALLRTAPVHARRCLEAAAETSSLKNFRMLAAFDALVLAALLENRKDDAMEAVGEAETYAAGESRPEYAARLQQVRSRLE